MLERIGINHRFRPETEATTIVKDKIAEMMRSPGQRDETLSGLFSLDVKGRLNRSVIKQGS